MPEFNKQQLLQTLQIDIQEIVRQVSALPDDQELLNRQPAFEAWSVAQILAHLVYYNDSYLPRLEAALRPGGDRKTNFKAGWLGNYFTNMMLPKPDGSVTSKMSAPKDARPEPALDALAVKQAFLDGGERLSAILQQASHSSLDIRVPTSISSLIRLKAGDTLRFLIAHQQRHLQQILRTLGQVRSA